MDIRTPPSVHEADTWYVVFHEKSSLRWLWWIGHFKHVSAFAYLPGFKAWIVYDVQVHYTRIIHHSHEAWIGGALAEWTRDAEIVKFKRRVDGRTKIASRFLFFCGPAIRHLIGLTSCIALRPDAIYRDIMRNGGERLGNEGRNAANPCRSQPRD